MLKRKDKVQLRDSREVLITDVATSPETLVVGLMGRRYVVFDRTEVVRILN